MKIPTNTTDLEAELAPNDSIYHLFPSSNQSGKPIRDMFRIGCIIIPSIISSVIEYYYKGPIRKQWNLSYSVAVNALRSLLLSLHRGTTPDVVGSQKRNSRPSPVPKTTKVEPGSFLTSSKAIRFLKKTAPGEFVTHSNDIVEITGEWVMAEIASDEFVILMCHGGAYVTGSAQMHRFLSSKISQASKCIVFAINYRLAPQNPYPCGLIDNLSAYIYLLERYEPQKIILMGDSAGGGFTLATLLALRDIGDIAMPRGAYVLSPWIDLTHSCESFHRKHEDYLPSEHPKDPRLGPNRVHYYTANSFLKLPFVSPFWEKDLSRLPPLLIQTGEGEKLYHEISLFAKNAAKEKENSVLLQVYNAHVHVFQIFGFSNGAKEAIKAAGDWIFQLTREESCVQSSAHEYYDFDGKLLTIEYM